MKKILLGFAILFIINEAFAQTPGSLDLTFGSSGIVTTNYTGCNIYGNATTILPDGKIIVVGGNDDFVIIKYNSDGTLDNTFGTGGKVKTPIGLSNDIALALAIQTDGKIVVAGNTAGSGAQIYSFALIRYNANGTLDNSFGTGGIIITSVGYASGAYSIAIQNNGKIVAAGYSRVSSGSYNDFTLIRYNVSGTLDNAFGTNGIVKTSVSSSSYIDRINAISIQPDGRIVVAGITAGSGNDFAVVRYDTTGALDNTFGTGGKVITPVSSSNDYAQATALQTDGKIVVAGMTSNGTNSNFVAVRYNTNGTLDNNFGTGGIVTTSLNYQIDEAYSVAIQNNGKIIVAGSTVVGSYYNFGVVRYNDDGTLDNTFGTGGKITTPIGSNGYSISKAVKIQTDGNIVVAGYSYDGTYQNFAVVRYIGDITTNIQQNNLGNDFTIFPNPVTDYLQIQTELKIIKIKIIDINGRTVLTTNRKIIDCSDLAKGIYVLKIENKNGVIVKRLLKE